MDHLKMLKDACDKCLKELNKQENSKKLIETFNKNDSLNSFINVNTFKSLVKSTYS